MYTISLCSKVMNRIQNYLILSCKQVGHSLLAFQMRILIHATYHGGHDKDLLLHSNWVSLDVDLNRNRSLHAVECLSM